MITINMFQVHPHLADLTDHASVHFTGMCVAGAPGSEDRNFLAARAEETDQRHSQSHGGQYTAVYFTASYSHHFD